MVQSEAHVALALVVTVSRLWLSIYLVLAVAADAELAQRTRGAVPQS